MTFEEFKELEKICKDAWKELAKTGSYWKPATLDPFINDCPACDISANAGNTRFHDCRLCPVDRWRKAAQEHEHSELAICQDIGRKPLYATWISDLSSPEDMKKAAKTISRLKWTYLPEYEKIKK